MQCRSIRRAWLICALCLLAAGVPAAFAADSEPANNVFGSPVADTVLAHNRGGHAFTFNMQALEARMSNNRTLSVMTGKNVISGNAFAGTSGIPTVIQNTGNSVIIQNATILNVQVR